MLRKFRDRFLLTNPVGKAFVDFYRSYSTAVADFIARHGVLRVFVRCGLLPFLGVSWLGLNLGSFPSLTLMLLLGSGLGGIVGFSWRKVKR